MTSATSCVSQAKRSDNKIFNIDSFVCRDGDLSKSCVKLEKNKLYPSDRTGYATESHYEIHLNSIVLTTRCGRNGGK